VRHAHIQDVSAATGTSLTNGNCLVFATPTGITFTDITSLKKLSVQTLDLEHRSPMKVVSLAHYKLLGIGSVSRKMDPDTGDIVQSSYFELRDPVTLERRSEGNDS
jgi:DNA damage-binding protein 1